MLGLHSCVGFSLVAEGRGYSAVHEFLTVMALLAQNTGSRARGLQQLWFLGSRAQAPWLWLPGLVALQHVGCSQIRDQTRVSYTSGWVLYH